MSDSKRDLNKVLLKEIDLIQACINRMAQNSFMIKGWTISLVAVVLAVLPESFDLTGLCLIGIVATLCFWYLDAFFLRTEKLFRWKYEHTPLASCRTKRRRISRLNFGHLPNRSIGRTTTSTPSRSARC
mgnify:CR=1 FL=1